MCLLQRCFHGARLLPENQNPLGLSYLVPIKITPGQAGFEFIFLFLCNKPARLRLFIMSQVSNGIGLCGISATYPSALGGWTSLFLYFIRMLF
jgi:hypothetical protein